ncbi:hypothetical protein HDU98_010991 [Podochytrium sp. JEL0797]|nr:hypothetical protein HDU98_010991 [Podochytrium sp. JEL0797]
MPAPQFPPGFVPNYPNLASWYSQSAAFVLLTILVFFLPVFVYNMTMLARTKHTKVIYGYLILWTLLRIVAFALRGYDLLEGHGSDYSDYQAAQIIISVGFMPLAEILAFNVAESSAIIYQHSKKFYTYLRAFIFFCFIFFGTCVAVYVFDFTLNKPFGADARNYTGDIVVREIGFDGLFCICVYTLFASLRNSYHLRQKDHVADDLVPRLRQMMYLVCFQSCLMVIKLSYITYRNWQPTEFKFESWYYLLSLIPEFIFVLPFLSFHFLKIYDDIYMSAGVVEKKDGLTGMSYVESGWVQSDEAPKPEEA